VNFTLPQWQETRCSKGLALGGVLLKGSEKDMIVVCKSESGVVQTLFDYVTGDIYL
jgi:hypothetical protein